MMAVSHNAVGQRLGRKGLETRRRTLNAWQRPIDQPSDAPVTLSGVAREAEIALLAFASDYWLAGAAAMPHPATKGRGTSVTSLNHAIWFHAPARADQWMLYRTSSPRAGHGRGLSQGLIFDSTGRLVASSSQEASMRAIVLP